MTCDERRDDFLLDAVGMLEPAERDELRAHLVGGCPACTGEAAEAQALVNLLPTALAVVSPRASVRDELMHRIAVDSRVSTNGATISLPKRTSQPRPNFVRRIMPLAAAAVLAAAITGGAMWHMMSDASRIVTTPDLQYVSLAGSDSQPTAHGRVFWDKDRNDWHVYFFDLKPLPAGKQYELWFITAKGEKLAAGMLDVDPSGAARLTTTVPPNVGPLAAAAVTDEITGGVQQPAGHIQLIGKIE